VAAEPAADPDRRGRVTSGRQGHRDVARGGRRALSWSAGASLAAGLGALGFLTVGRFTVGLADFAPMAHMWTVWSIASATVGFGAQIETIEGLHSGRGAVSRRHLWLALVGASLIWCATYFWRDALFGSNALFWPIVCTLVPFGSLITGTARGALAAHGRQRRLAFVIAGENVVRFALAGFLMLIGGSVESLALALLAGFGVALAGLADMGTKGVDESVSTGASGAVGAFAGLVAHVSLVLPPSVLALQGQGPEVVSGVFLVLTYLRAPYQFLLGLSPVLTARSFSDQGGGPSWLANGRRVAAVALGLMGVGALGGLLLGDLISTVILGTTDIVTPTDYAILAALVIAVSIAILRTIFVIPFDRGLVLRAWVTAAVASVLAGVLATGPTALFAGLLVGVVLCLAQLTLWGNGSRGAGLVNGSRSPAAR